MTTGIAFLSLLASSLPGHRQLGVFAASGVIAAAACTLLVLPLILPTRAPIDQRTVASPLATATAGVVTALRSRRGLVAVAVGLLLAAAVPGLRSLKVETDLERFNALSEEAREDSRQITEVWGSTMGHTSIVVDGRDVDEALVRAEEVKRLLEGGTGRVEAVQSIVGLLPDRQTQQRNRERWREFWSEDRKAALRVGLERSMRERGFNPSSIEPFWDGLDVTGDAITLEELMATPLARILEGWVAADGEIEARVLTRCSFAPSAVVGQQTEWIRAEIPGALVADGRQMVTRLSAITFRELKKMSLLSFVLVVGFLLPFSRNVRQPLALMAVLVVTFVWVLGALGWLGVPITMMNSLIAIFIFGLTIDYAIFLLHAVDEAEVRSDLVSAAVVVSSMTTLVGFAALLLARHPSLSSIGITTVVGITCGLVASMTVVPLLSASRDSP
jgi:predicted exporter